MGETEGTSHGESPDGKNALESLKARLLNHKLISLVVLIFSVAVAVAMGFNAITDAARNIPRSENPVVVTIETDPAVFESGRPDWEPYVYKLTRPLDDMGIPPERPCRNWHGWARRHEAIDAGVTKARVAVTGSGSGSVLIESFRVNVVERQPPLSAPTIYCRTGGASATPRGIYVNLDANPPSFRYEQDGGGEVRPFLFTLKQGETEFFQIHASADKCFCRWTGELILTVDGRRKIILIADHGSPFETSGQGDVGDGLEWIEGGWQPLSP